jgi:hypothetical protein
MSKTVTPQPMPTTGMPDRVTLPPPAFNQKRGMTTDRPMPVNPGRPPSGKSK